MKGGTTRKLKRNWKGHRIRPYRALVECVKRARESLYFPPPRRPK